MRAAQLIGSPCWRGTAARCQKAAGRRPPHLQPRALGGGSLIRAPGLPRPHPHAPSASCSARVAFPRPQHR